MKNNILIVVMVMLFASANAQIVRFGLKGGINFSTLVGDTEDNNSRLGFNGGGFAEIKIIDKFFIQPELLYSEEGTIYDDDDKLKTSYFKIPILAKYYVAKKISIEAGPQIGFLLSASEFGQDAKDIVNSFDFGAALGLNYDFTNNIFIGGRYNLGLYNIAKLDNLPEFDPNFTVKNSVFTVFLGYKF